MCAKTTNEERENDFVECIVVSAVCSNYFGVSISSTRKIFHLKKLCKVTLTYIYYVASFCAIIIIINQIKT